MNFNFVGKIAAIPETDKFKPYSDDMYDTGWEMKRLFFSAVNGDNRHMMTIQGGNYPNKSDYKVKTLTPVEGDAKKKYDWIEIPWKDRLLAANVKKVASFRKFTIDLNPYGYRNRITTVYKQVKEGKGVTDEMLKGVGLTSESEVEGAYKAAWGKYWEFISEWDFVDQMRNVLSDSAYKDTVFHIRGTIEKQFSEKNFETGKQAFYTSLKPQMIYLASEKEEESCTGTALLNFTNGAVDDGSLEEKGKYYIKAYTMEYASSRKANVPAEFVLVVPKAIYNKKTEKLDDTGKLSKYIIDKQFTVDDYKVYALGVEFDMLEGREKVEITEDMLDDEQKEQLELGLIDFDDIRRDMGDSVYGEKVVEYRFKGWTKGYTKGRAETAFTEDDLVIKPLKPLDDEADFESGADASDIEDELSEVFNVEKVKPSKKVESDDDDDLFK